MKSLSHWLHQHPPGAPQEKYACFCPQDRVTCGRLYFRKSYQSRRHQALKHTISWGPDRPSSHISNQRVSVLSPLPGVAPSDSLGGLSLSAHEFYFGFVNAIVLINLCMTWNIHLVASTWLLLGIPSLRAVAESLSALRESSGADASLKEDCSLSYEFPDWEMREPGLVLPSLLSQDAQRD